MHKFCNKRDKFLLHVVKMPVKLPVLYFMVHFIKEQSLVSVLLKSCSFLSGFHIVDIAWPAPDKKIILRGKVTEDILWIYHYTYL